MIDVFQKGIQRGIIFFQQIEADSETKNSFFFFFKFCTKRSSIQFDMYP